MLVLPETYIGIGSDDYPMERTAVETADMRLREDYDWSQTPPSMTVVEALATVEDVSSTELTQRLGGPLYEYVDPGSLDSLVSGSQDISISFAIDSYRIHIDGSELTIYET